MSLRVIRFLCLLAALIPLSVALADEKADEIAKQKATAKANFEKINLKLGAFLETPDLIVCGTIPEKDARVIGELMQKQFALSVKALKFDEKDKTIRGKFTVYCFGSKREYATFARQVRMERPEASETSTYDISGDDCYLAVVVESQGGLPIDPEVAGSIAAAVLERKAGGSFLPPWVKIGFRRAITMRVEPRYGEATRKTIKAYLASKGKSPTAGEAWDESSSDKLIAATSVMEFLTFGTTPPKVIDFITGFRPSEDVPEPGVMQALTSAGYKDDELDKAWRAWVAKMK